MHKHEEYTKLFRICILETDSSNMVLVKFIDLEKGEKIRVKLPKTHRILSQADGNGLVVVRCQCAKNKEIYPDIPEITEQQLANIKKQNRIAFIGMTLLLVPAIAMAIYVSVTFDKVLQNSVISPVQNSSTSIAITAPQ